MNRKRLLNLLEKDKTGKPTEFHIEAMTSVYKANLDRIGLLTSREIFLLMGIQTGLLSAAAFNDSYVAPDENRSWRNGQLYNRMMLQHMVSATLNLLNSALKPDLRMPDLDQTKSEFDEPQPFAPPLDGAGR